MVTPSDWVRDFIQAQKNYFAELEDIAEEMLVELAVEPQGFMAAARDRLASRHGIQVRVVPLEVLPESVRRFDHHRRRLFLSEVLTGSGRSFSMAYQLAVLEHGPLLDVMADRAGPPDRPTRNLLKVSLANYLAAALMMPYAAFHEAAERTAYDIELVRARFGVSYEQACHRLTTLSRPGARGVPFFMLRVDSAGTSPSASPARPSLFRGSAAVERGRPCARRRGARRRGSIRAPEAAVLVRGRRLRPCSRARSRELLGHPIDVLPCCARAGDRRNSRCRPRKPLEAERLGEPGRSSRAAHWCRRRSTRTRAEGDLVGVVEGVGGELAEPLRQVGLPALDLGPQRLEILEQRERPTSSDVMSRPHLPARSA